MELFQKRKQFIFFPIYLLSLVISVNYATIPFEFAPKEQLQVLGKKIVFSLKFTGANEEAIRGYNFVSVSAAPRRDSSGGALILIYSFPVLKKPGVQKGHLSRNHPFFHQISDIRTAKEGNVQTFSMEMRMVCRLSTNFKFAAVKDSKTSQSLGMRLLRSYAIASLNIQNNQHVYYPGDKLYVDCQIHKCDNLDTDVNQLKHHKFILTTQQNESVPIPKINASAVVVSVHDNVIETKFLVSKKFVTTCRPIRISCALDKKYWESRTSLTPPAIITFCRNHRSEFRVKWGKNNYTNHLKHVADGATFSTICTAFTRVKVNFVSEGQPTKLISRATLSERTQNAGEFAIQQQTKFRLDDLFCYYPRKTFRCFLNDTKNASREAPPVPLRPGECEPKIISFKPKKLNKHLLNVTCIIRKTIGERIPQTGIVDEDKVINVTERLNNDTSYKRNRNAIVMNGSVSFSTCANLRSRNLTCYYHYDGVLYTASLDLSQLCKASSKAWLLWLLLLLLIPLLCLLCCLCANWCRKNKERLLIVKERLLAKKRKEKGEAAVEEKAVKVVVKTKAEKKKQKKEKAAEEKAKRIEARRMYRMFKKRRPFGWRELNDHFLWLSMMAHDEQRSRSLSPSCQDYAEFRLPKRRARFGNRELLSYSQSLLQQGGHTDDLATLRELQSVYGNWSQMTALSQEPSTNAESKEARMQKMLTDMYEEGAIGSYNQLETYGFAQNINAPEKTESSDSSSERDSKRNNNQRSSHRKSKKRKRRRSRRFDDIV